MHTHQHWLHLQRSLYRRVAKAAKHVLGVDDPEIRKYTTKFDRELSNFLKISSTRELLESIENYDTVLWGDYHSLPQAQRTVVQMMRRALPRIRRAGKRVVLALEMVGPQDNQLVEQYLMSRMPEKTFLKKIRYHSRWGFDWESYRAFFELARAENFRIVGIHGGNLALEKQDRLAAKVMCQIHCENPGHIVFAVLGDLHLAPSHVPLEIKTFCQQARQECKVLTIHQNADKIFWELAEQGLEQLVQVVKLHENAFCIISSLPWLKLHNHVRWSEKTQNEPYKSNVGHNAISNCSLHHDASDNHNELSFCEDEIKHSLNAITSFLELKPPMPLDDYELWPTVRYQSVARLSKLKRWGAHNIRHYARYLDVLENHFIVGENIFLLNRPTLNHVASQSAIYLYSKLSHGSLKPRFYHSDKYFYELLWQQALGYFGSKVLNHKRQCSRSVDLIKILQQQSDESDFKEHFLARATLWHIANERTSAIVKPPQLRKEKFWLWLRPHERHALYFRLAQLLGEILGEALFAATLDEYVKRDEIRKLYTTSFGSNHEARDCYLDWACRLDSRGYR